MNDQIVKTVGPKFKEFRKKMNISLNELARRAGVSSRSTLSRWERGEEGLPVEIFERLITCLNLSYQEIMINEVEIQDLLNQIEYLYQNNDLQGLKALITVYLERYRQSAKELIQVELLFKSAIALNYYLDLTGDDLSDEKFKLELTKRVSSIRYWLKKEIVLFGNVQLLLDADTIYKLARSLASENYERNLVSIDVSIALLNAVYALIKKKAPGRAQRLLNVAAKLNYSSNDVLVKLRIKFMQALLQYLDSHNEYGIIKFLNSVEDKKLKSDYQFAFLQIKEIYQLSS